MCAKPLEEWMIKPDKDIKAEDPNPAATVPGGAWLGGAGSSSDP